MKIDIISCMKIMKKLSPMAYPLAPKICMVSSSVLEGNISVHISIILLLNFFMTQLVKTIIEIAVTGLNKDTARVVNIRIT